MYDQSVTLTYSLFSVNQSIEVTGAKEIAESLMKNSSITDLEFSCGQVFFSRGQNLVHVIVS